MKVKVSTFAGASTGIINDMRPQFYELKIISSTATAQSINSPSLVEVDVVSCASPSRIEMELVADFVLVQPVLKWLQKPEFVKNVILLHSASSSHDFWHAARSDNSPDD